MEKFRRKPKRGSEKTFKSEITSFRREKDMSLRELADMMGVSVSCIWTWESGRVIPRKENAEKLEKLLTLDTADRRKGKVKVK
jgi:ribosome-binding protein aMBF1 (putative translation factor)